MITGRQPYTLRIRDGEQGLGAVGGATTRAAAALEVVRVVEGTVVHAAEVDVAVAGRDGDAAGLALLEDLEGAAQWPAGSG